MIDALWPGFVDLRVTPELARLLPEACELLALAAVLERLNREFSPVWTAKCDFWPELSAEDFDPDELDAPGGEPHAMGCYIDLLPRKPQQWSPPPMAATRCKDLCRRLNAVPMSSCRVDLIIRRALTGPASEDIGITAYLTACGATVDAARLVLESALAAFADVFMANSTLQ